MMTRTLSTERPEFSVIIPSYNSSPTIARCLEALFAQRTDRPFEVIVADSSEDASRSIIRQGWPSVNLVELEKRTFAGPSRNAGAAVATGRYLCFLDADCIADSLWVDTIDKKFREGWVAVGGSIENGNKNCYWSRAEYLLELLEFSPRSPARGALFLSSANSAYSKEWFAECAGFPEIRLGEDMLLAERLRKKGADLRFFPEMKVRHIQSAGLGKFIRKQVLHGTYSVLARRRAASLPGGFLLRHPYLLPFLPLLRFLRILQRARKIDPSLYGEVLFTLPAFLAGNLAWSWGFLKGLLGFVPEEKS